MAKYGIDNFDFEIIEGPISNFNEREIYWIKYFNSYEDKTKGYNLTPGGEEPLIFTNEDSCFCLYSNELVNNIILDIINTDKTFKEISDKYKVSEQYIASINRGKVRKNDKYEYPLRKSKNKPIATNVVFDIIYDLTYTTFTYEKIAKKNNVGELTVYRINYGKEKYCLDSY